jgi:hypothetical protein
MQTYYSTLKATSDSEEYNKKCFLIYYLRCIVQENIVIMTKNDLEILKGTQVFNSTKPEKVVLEYRL